MELRATGELIGDCASGTDLEDARQAEIGFTLDPSSRGTATRPKAPARCSATCSAPATSTGSPHGATRATPRPSALLERLGMRREGHLVESTWAKGEWTDDLLYAILEREWRQAS